MKIEVKMIPEKNFIKNGDYQKIYWLGVNGHIIINEHDKEILLVDPQIGSLKKLKKKNIRL
ncbi:MAG: hypothetical protein ACTSP9_10895 [Promethearchaeota archaeon]